MSSSKPKGTAIRTSRFAVPASKLIVTPAPKPVEPEPRESKTSE